MEKPHVDKWDLPAEASIMSIDGSNIIFDFNKVFNIDIDESLKSFIVKKKGSYITCYRDKYDDDNPEILMNKGAAHYVNYLMHFYDKNDLIPAAFLKLKYMIDKKSIELSDKRFRKQLYGIMLTPEIKKMISDMVDDNWCIEIDSAEFSEQLLFEERHVKLLVKISITMKLVIPIIMHYIYTSGANKDKIFYFIKPATKLFDDSVDVYMKLYCTVLSRVEKNIYHNRTSWNQQEILDVEEYGKIEKLLQVDIISEAMLRYVFEKNPIFFNSVFINKQLRYLTKTPYNEALNMVDNEKNAEGLSGMDKLEMITVKIDESIPIMSNLNVTETIERIKRSLKIANIDEEVKYYMNHSKIDKLQTQILNYFYANAFGGYRDLGMLNRTEYFTLLVMMKKKLIYSDYQYLPQILSSNITTFSKRAIQNRKFLTKIETSSVYVNLVENKFKELIEFGKDKIIIGLLSSILNSKYTIVDYQAQEKFGEELIIHNADAVSDEFLNFLSSYL